MFAKSEGSKGTEKTKKATHSGERAAFEEDFTE